MSRTIRIGTRDSELALWQATTVKDQLEALGHTIKLVPVKSTGDLVLDKPLYELGITGIFTKTLDVAMLNGEIDIAVHSMKDVPTMLPKGIVQAAVLKRANYMDILAFKNNEEFLGSPDGIIATGSLRRKAQWLNQYPTHTVVDLRGNVNSRLEKLNKNDWNGAIFAAAGLERIGLEPENTIGLTWMVPAPAQGAIMVVAMENDLEIREICAELNHRETEICTKLERDFLRELEGGCSAPIGALAYIDKEEKVNLKGVLLTIDGSQKLEAALTAPLGKHENLGIDAAKSILSRGGRRLMNELQGADLKTNVFSTKKLTEAQLQKFSSGIRVDSEDFIKISPNRISPIILKKNLGNIVFTSKNAVESLLTNCSPAELQFKNIYCVGRKTKRLIQKKIGPVAHVENSATDLANYLVEYMDGTQVTYFHGNLSLEDLPSILEGNNINVNKVEAYKTKLSGKAIPESVEGILFYSPSTIESYLLKNKPHQVAYCIGETTATEARKHFKEVKVAIIPDVESVIELVNSNYSQ
ncbi:MULTISPECIES: hydroxymethylbilane synthase [Maribacter]|uniref:Hydroxymethylbilane synthase n=1 Tax=Maribacter flavus TaxID=1658664 RepID=A0ABU7IE37_9FLAO|nr:MULTISPECIES: hydroxymethylbilane synthase [Maribacter]MDC6404068.1 hydroxymethylbilane synthase [Maribacter sp. PR66]MEE1971209.1 hydroxymethylbilane synthase [Maribacter flavus]